MKISKESVAVPTAYCPICGKKCTRASLISEDGHYQEPKPGDATVCIDCGGWLVFREDLTYRKMDDLDLRDMDNDTHLRLLRVSRAVREVPRK